MKIFLILSFIFTVNWLYDTETKQPYGVTLTYQNVPVGQEICVSRLNSFLGCFISEGTDTVAIVDAPVDVLDRPFAGYSYQVLTGNAIYQTNELDFPYKSMLPVVKNGS
jgi:hypothetical protein